MKIKIKYNIGDTVYRIVDNFKIIYETKSRVTIGEHLLYKDVEEIITHFKQQYYKQINNF